MSPLDGWTSTHLFLASYCFFRALAETSNVQSLLMTSSISAAFSLRISYSSLQAYPVNNIDAEAFRACPNLKARPGAAH